MTALASISASGPIQPDDDVSRRIASPGAPWGKGGQKRQKERREEESSPPAYSAGLKWRLRSPRTPPKTDNRVITGRRSRDAILRRILHLSCAMNA